MVGEDNEPEPPSTMSGTESKETIPSVTTRTRRAKRRVDGSKTRTLLAWTIAAVVASWALNLITLWLALEQHKDSRELLRVQIAMELDKEFDSAKMRRARQRLASQFLDKQELTEYRVMDFFDKVGMYVHQDRVDDDTVYQSFSYWIERYWPVHEAFVKQFRADEHDDGLYLSFEELYERMVSDNAKELNEPRARVRPTPRDIEEFLGDEKALVP